MENSAEEKRMLVCVRVLAAAFLGSWRSRCSQDLVLCVPVPQSSKGFLREVLGPEIEQWREEPTRKRRSEGGWCCG